MNFVRLSLLVFFFTTTSTNLLSHTRSESFSIWNKDNHIISATFTIPTKEIIRIPLDSLEESSLSDFFNQYIADHLSVKSSESDCKLKNSPKKQISNNAFIKTEIVFDCGMDAPERIVFTGFFEFTPSHIHYARLIDEKNENFEYLFLYKQTEWDIRNGAADSVIRNRNFSQFIIYGIEHILSGLDHIAFLLALILVAKSSKEILISISGFTIGHSLTLSIAALGKFRPDTKGIEAFIGLTILLVSGTFILSILRNKRLFIIYLSVLPVLIGMISWFLNIREFHILIAYLGMGLFIFCYLKLDSLIKEDKFRGIHLCISTIAFGMIHGFGFAGFLMETGLEKEELLLPLFGFNIGVEIGQLIFVGFCLFLVWAYQNKIQMRIPAIKSELISQFVVLILTALGTYWFIQRSFEI